MSQPAREHRLIIGLCVDFMNGTAQAQKLLAGLQNAVEVLSLSSVYKRYRSSRRENLDSEVWLVCKAATTLSPQEILQEFKVLEIDAAPMPTQAAPKLLLLAFDDKIHMTPGLTLPHPALVRLPVVLTCATEVWSAYAHPILHRNLAELLKSQESSPDFEFLAQGKSLLDF